MQKRSNFDNFESAHYSTSVSMPLNFTPLGISDTMHHLILYSYVSYKIAFVLRNLYIFDFIWEFKKEWGMDFGLELKILAPPPFWLYPMHIKNNNIDDSWLNPQNHKLVKTSNFSHIASLELSPDSTFSCTAFVLIAAHAPISAHPSHFEIISHKIINHLPIFISQAGLDNVYLFFGLILVKNIEINKRLP